MKTVLIGTSNAAKVREVRKFLRDLAINWQTPVELAVGLEIKETGDTFAENAIQKALGFAAHTGLPVLSGDAGLVVPALGGWPGIHSRRLKDGRPASDEEIVALVRQKVRSLPESERQYRFVSVFAFAQPTGTVDVAEGAHEGELRSEPHPDPAPGMPYRRFWYLPQYGKYFLDLTDKEYDEINHNGSALAGLRPTIERYLQEK